MNGIFIKRLMPDGAALQSSRIIPGDRVLDINGVSLDGTNLAQVNNKIDSYSTTNHSPILNQQPIGYNRHPLGRQLPSPPNFLLSVSPRMSYILIR